MDRNALPLQFYIDRAEAVVAQEPRTRLGSHALLSRVKRYNSGRIENALNQVYTTQPSRLHPAWRLVQTLSKPR